LLLILVVVGALLAEPLDCVVQDGDPAGPVLVGAKDRYRGSVMQEKYACRPVVDAPPVESINLAERY
jgi:hypothetical protein